MSDFIIKANQYEKIANSGGVAKGMRRSRSQMSGVKHRAAAKSNNKAVVNEDISTSYYGNRPFDKMSEVLYYGKLNPQIAGEHLDILRGGSKPFTYEEIEFMAVWYLTAYDKFLGGWLDGSGQLRPMHFEEVTSKVENQQVSTMANTCTNPKQSNNWFILNLNNGIETNPPCGCYVNTNLGILDVIPFTKLMKLLGKVKAFKAWKLAELVASSSYIAIRRALIDTIDEWFNLYTDWILRANAALNPPFGGLITLPDFGDLYTYGDDELLDYVVAGLDEMATEHRALTIVFNDLSRSSDFFILKQGDEIPFDWKPQNFTFTDSNGNAFDFDFADIQFTIKADSGTLISPTNYQIISPAQIEVTAAQNMLNKLTDQMEIINNVLYNGQADLQEALSFYENIILANGPDLDDIVYAASERSMAIKKTQVSNNISREIQHLESESSRYANSIVAKIQNILKDKAAQKSQAQQEILSETSRLKLEADLALQSGAGASGFLAVLGLALFGVGREKQCFDPRTRLNPDTCECECWFPSLYEVCPVDATASPLWGAPQWVWDNVVPMLPQSEEVRTCYKKCCDSQTAWVNSVGYGCGCNCFGEIPSYAVPLGGGAADSYFKSGTGAKCCRELQFSLLGGNWQRGSCVSSFEETRRTALGQVWDADKCEFICPNTGKPEGERCIPNETYPVSVTYVDGNGVSQTEDSLCYCSPYLDCETSANCYVGSMCECIHFSDTHCYCEYSPNAEYECNTRVYLGDCNAPCPDPAPGLELCGVTAYGVCCDGQLRDTIADGPCPSCS